MDQAPGDSARWHDPMTRLRPGLVVDGKYRVDCVLGRGGMGVVVAATHVVLGERMALKFLRAFDQDIYGDFYARFAREARVCARLKNDHIARVHDVGTWQGTVPYMVMDYVEGRSLQKELATLRRIPLVRAVDLAFQICEALAEAHALGIIHRDLKPANLVITTRADGSELLKVLDFGISKCSAGDEFGEVTRVGSMLGTPKYMAAEQLVGGEVDARTDIWSIGAILYTMLTGRPAYDCGSLHQLLLAVASGAPVVPPSAFAATIPAAIDAVVLRCLAHDRAARFGSVAQLGEALMAAVGATVPAGARVQIAGLIERGGAVAGNDGPAALSATSTDKHLALTLEGSTPPSTAEVRASSAPPRRATRGRQAGAWMAFTGAVLAMAFGIARRPGATSYPTCATSSWEAPRAARTRTRSVPSKSLAPEQPSSLIVDSLDVVLMEPVRVPSMSAIAASVNDAQAAGAAGRVRP
jgi:serine/threonine-protein kinase